MRFELGLFYILNRASINLLARVLFILMILKIHSCTLFDRHNVRSVKRFYPSIQASIVHYLIFASYCRIQKQNRLDKNFIINKQQRLKLKVQNIKMSHIIYSQNKIICRITLSPSIQSSPDPYLKATLLMVIIYHYQYPSVLYKKVHAHISHLLPTSTSAEHLRLIYKNKQLKSDVPIGLYLDGQSEVELQVGISNIQVAQCWQLLKYNLKRALAAINTSRGCDYFFRRISKQDQQQIFQKYYHGQSHGLQKQKDLIYQGDYIMTRYFIQGQIVQRKSKATESTNVLQMIREDIPELKDIKFAVQAHGVHFDTQMSVKQFLDYWSYNDGYCYLKIVLEQQIN